MLLDANVVDVIVVCSFVVMIQSDVGVVFVVVGVVVSLPDELLEEKDVDAQLDMLEVLFELPGQCWHSSRTPCPCC